MTHDNFLKRKSKGGKALMVALFPFAMLEKTFFALWENK